MLRITADELTVDLLRQELHYDPETGQWRWLVKRQGRRTVVGTICESNGGYRMIKLFRTQYKAARLAWFYMTGTWPEPEIDHKNRVPDDDRWDNLQEATRQQNNSNRRPYKNWNRIGS